MKCPKCGNELETGAKFCGKCGTVIRAGSAPAPAPRPAPRVERPTEKPKGTFAPVDAKAYRMAQGIALGHGEKVVRRYNVARYTFGQGSMEVIVTNKRVIRYEESQWFLMTENNIDEVNLDVVHGVSTTMKRSLSSLSLFAAIALLMFGIIALSFSMNFGAVSGIAVFIFCLLVAILAIVLGLRPTMYFCLHGAVGGDTLQTAVNYQGRLFGRNNDSVFFQFKPTAETTEMLKEIGACIYDLKTLGDAAIEKWS